MGKRNLGTLTEDGRAAWSAFRSENSKVVRSRLAASLRLNFVDRHMGIVRTLVIPAGAEVSLVVNNTTTKRRADGAKLRGHWVYTEAMMSWSESGADVKSNGTLWFEGLETAIVACDPA